MKSVLVDWISKGMASRDLRHNITIPPQPLFKSDVSVNLWLPPQRPWTLSVTTQAHGVGQCSHSMMSAPSSAVCCTYGTPLIMPLQFQDWTQIEESDGEDVHTTVVLGGRIVRCLTLSTSVLRRDNSHFTSFRSWPHWSDVAVLLQVRTSLLRDVTSCLRRLISQALKLLATELYRLLWECEPGGDDTSAESGDTDEGSWWIESWMMPSRFVE